MKIKTWQEHMSNPRDAFQCSMNCSGVGMGSARDTDCGDCIGITIQGCPVAARDAEIADLRTALAAAPVQAGYFPPRDLSKPAEQQGVFQKFDVRRTDGSSAPGASITVAVISSWTLTMTRWPSPLCKHTRRPARQRILNCQRIW